MPANAWSGLPWPWSRLPAWMPPWPPFSWYNPGTPWQSLVFHMLAGNSSVQGDQADFIEQSFVLHLPHMAPASARHPLVWWTPSESHSERWNQTGCPRLVEAVTCARQSLRGLLWLRSRSTAWMLHGSCMAFISSAHSSRKSSCEMGQASCPHAQNLATACLSLVSFMRAGDCGENQAGCSRLFRANNCPGECLMGAALPACLNCVHCGWRHHRHQAMHVDGPYLACRCTTAWRC